jgi:hypothetical protein
LTSLARKGGQLAGCGSLLSAQPYLL